MRLKYHSCKMRHEIRVMKYRGIAWILSRQRVTLFFYSLNNLKIVKILDMVDLLVIFISFILNGIYEVKATIKLFSVYTEYSGTLTPHHFYIRHHTFVIFRLLLLVSICFTL